MLQIYGRFSKLRNETDLATFRYDLPHRRGPVRFGTR